MNITFLIGNGFDLNLGLKTLYKHFLHEYIEDSSNDSNIIKEFKESILKDIELWSDAEKTFGQYTSKYSGADGLEAFLECHMDFCMKLGKYLKMQECRLYESVDPLMGKLFLESLKGLTLGFREEQTTQLNNAFNLFSGGYKYNFISFNYTETIDRCIVSAKNIPKALGTRIFSNSRYENSFGQLIHVHGYTNRDMALGVNDESQILNSQLFEDVSEEDLAPIIKRLTNKINEQRIDEKTLALLNNSDFIYIYGMSIGDTDRIWWERICDLMKKKPNVRVIIHQYDAPNEGIFLRGFRKYEREIRSRFASYSKDETIITSIMDRVHITKYNIFNPLTDIVNNDDNVSVYEDIMNKDFATV